MPASFRSFVLTIMALGLLPGARGDAGEGEGAWAFTPVARPAVPQASGSDPAWSLHPVDRFIQDRHVRERLRPAVPASRAALLKRYAVGLTGLPPRWEDLEAFVGDERPGAKERLLDRYLASPQYGERWGRHWLDVVRYADTDGFAIDGVRPTLWRFRDYVVRSFNADKPFDQFVREQLAGDELGESSPGLVATGFYRLGPWEADNMIAEVRRQNYLNEITSAVGAGFLGLTVGCARCHDHKYDPIPTEDFYRLQTFFVPLKQVERDADYSREEMLGGYGRNKRRVEAEKGKREAALASVRAELEAKLRRLRDLDHEEMSEQIFEDALKATGDAAPFTEEERKRYAERKQQVEKATAELKPYAAKAWTISVPGEEEAIPPTHILLGGDVARPGKKVEPGFLSAVSLPDPPPAGGRPARRDLAQWLLHPRHPLTARVLVNRLWHYHFGKGIVSTPNDFGKNGAPPSHPELLDYLAAELLEHGWALKPLHRMLLTTRLYGMASTHADAGENETRDPENQWLWRAPLRRLDAEAVRDRILASSGRLSLEQGGPGFFEALPREMETKYPFFDWNASSEESRARRSLYIYQRRNLVLPMMEAFDAADASESCARREANVNVAQAFELFNSAFAHENGQHLARRLQAEAKGASEGVVEEAFKAILQRAPRAQELEAARRFLQSAPSGTGVGDLCLALLNTNEFLYLD